MDAAGVIAHYVMDGDKPLTAETGGNTNFYLYGLGAIGEKTTAWNYSLPDGTNTPRQLSDISGDITLSSRYTPWGDTLDTYGTGNFTFGYFGGVMDAATGLLYVGNGQYYDPATGRFLTRNVNPDSTNPYVLWNPIGAIVGPLGLVALLFGRKKKGSKVGTFLVLVLVLGSVGMTLAACGPAPSPDPTNPTPQVPPTQTPSPIPSETPSPTQTPSPTAPSAPTNTPSLPDCPDPRYYDCSDIGDYECIEPTDEPVLQIAHTIAGEGGLYSGKFAANIMQTVLNRAYIAWEVSHRDGINPNNIPWSRMTKEQLENLLLYILSEDDGSGSSSAYDAWSSPYPHYGYYWQDILDGVENLLDSPGAQPKSAPIEVAGEVPAAEVKSNINVIYYAATDDPTSKPPKGWVHVDIIDCQLTINPKEKKIFQYYMVDFWNPPDAVLDCN